MLKIAGVQFIGEASKEANIATAIRLVRQAAAQGARIVCLSELFSTMYFCVETRREYFEWAKAVVEGLPRVNQRLLELFEAAYGRRP